LSLFHPLPYSHFHSFPTLQFWVFIPTLSFSHQLLIQFPFLFSRYIFFFLALFSFCIYVVKRSCFQYACSSYQLVRSDLLKYQWWRWKVWESPRRPSNEFARNEANGEMGFSLRGFKRWGQEKGSIFSGGVVLHVGMETRLKKYNRQVSPERAKVWTEKSPKYHQSLKVPVIYYLCRNRQLEHPHFMEVPLSSPDGLYLRGRMSNGRQSFVFPCWGGVLSLLFYFVGCGFWRLSCVQMWLIDSMCWEVEVWLPCTHGLARGEQVVAFSLFICSIFTLRKREKIERRKRKSKLILDWFGASAF